MRGHRFEAVLYWCPAIVTMALIAVISHQTELPEAPGGLPDWILHGGEYAFLGATCLWGATRGMRRSRRGVAAALTALLVAVAYGAADEFHQSLVGRHMSLLDWVADAVGAAVSVVAGTVLLRRL